MQFELQMLLKFDGQQTESVTAGLVDACPAAWYYREVPGKTP